MITDITNGQLCTLMYISRRIVLNVHQWWCLNASQADFVPSALARISYPMKSSSPTLQLTTGKKGRVHNSCGV